MGKWWFNNNIHEVLTPMKFINNWHLISQAVSIPQSVDTSRSSLISVTVGIGMGAIGAGLNPWETTCCGNMGIPTAKGNLMGVVWGMGKHCAAAGMPGGWVASIGGCGERIMIFFGCDKGGLTVSMTSLEYLGFLDGCSLPLVSSILLRLLSIVRVSVEVDRTCKGVKKRIPWGAGAGKAGFIGNRLGLGGRECEEGPTNWEMNGGRVKGWAETAEVEVRYEWSQSLISCMKGLCVGEGGALLIW